MSLLIILQFGGTRLIHRSILPRSLPTRLQLHLPIPSTQERLLLIIQQQQPILPIQLQPILPARLQARLPTGLLTQLPLPVLRPTQPHPLQLLQLLLRELPGKDRHLHSKQPFL